MVGNLEKIREELIVHCRAIVESEFGGELILDEKFIKKVEILLNSIDWSTVRATDLSSICDMTPTTMYKIKNGELTKLSQKIIIGIMDGLLGAKLEYKA